jgi:hypothetical protein
MYLRVRPACPEAPGAPRLPVGERLDRSQPGERGAAPVLLQVACTADTDCIIVFLVLENPGPEPFPCCIDPCCCFVFHAARHHCCHVLQFVSACMRTVFCYGCDGVGPLTIVHAVHAPSPHQGQVSMCGPLAAVPCSNVHVRACVNLRWAVKAIHRLTASASRCAHAPFTYGLIINISPHQSSVCASNKQRQQQLQQQHCLQCSTAGSAAAAAVPVSALTTHCTAT